jgi:hypothetical protein
LEPARANGVFHLHQERPARIAITLADCNAANFS